MAGSGNTDAVPTGQTGPTLTLPDAAPQVPTNGANNGNNAPGGDVVLGDGPAVARDSSGGGAINEDANADDNSIIYIAAGASGGVCCLAILVSLCICRSRSSKSDKNNGHSSLYEGEAYSDDEDNAANAYLGDKEMEVAPASGGGGGGGIYQVSFWFFNQKIPL